MITFDNAGLESHRSFKPKHEEAIGAMKFRLLTYNIHKGIGMDGKFRPDRIIAVLNHHNADIVLLQEVDRGVPRSNHHDLASLLARSLQYEYRAAGMNVFMKRGRYGNATLARYPISRQRNIDLTVSWRKRRGAQHTSVTIHENDRKATVEIFNVHLGLSAMERRRQMADLLESSQITELGNDHPCIIAGDMNDWRGVLKRQRFVKHGFTCATNRKPGSRWAIKTFPSVAPTGGLDKIFYRGPLKPIRVYRSRLLLAQEASDHLPVIADFEIPTKALSKGFGSTYPSVDQNASSTRSETP